MRFFFYAILISIFAITGCGQRNKVEGGLISEARVRPCKQPPYNWIPIRDDCNGVPNYSAQSKGSFQPQPTNPYGGGQRQASNPAISPAISFPSTPSLPNISGSVQDFGSDASRAISNSTGDFGKQVQSDFKYTYDSIPSQKEAGQAINRNLNSIGVGGVSGKK
ncbi:MAG: hypothetical protein ACK5BE_02175 [Alphaproteobacteria bacterium]|jgi:hypothetical protein